ncbi:hypothetical protein NKG94_05280 [Micromonospora sp. M12]
MRGDQMMAGMKRAALSVIAGPVGIVAYGLVRLWGDPTGCTAPGSTGRPRTWWLSPAWCASCRGARAVPSAAAQPVADRRGGRHVGRLAATMVQFVADIVEGLLAEDRAEMSALGADFKDIPGVEVAFYDVVPQLFFLGLVVLAGMLAARRRLPWWSVALLFVGIVLPVVTLDLLPIGGLCMAVALARRCRQ